MPIKRALISVSDKTGVADFASELASMGIEILSTGGTAKLLQENGVAVIDVSDHTGFPEMMDGRLKTLHPKIHGGLLGRRGTDDEVMAKHGIDPIDLVVVNLYPFEATIARQDCSLEMAIENIDIGGPTMLRAAAKNHADVTVIVDADDYQQVIEEMKNNDGEVTAASRFSFATKVYEHTARYDGAIANYLGRLTDGEQDTVFPRTYSNQYLKKQEMRYGENPHQAAAFYVEHEASEASVSSAEQLQGKELSYNNIADTDAALECVKQFTDKAACVIVKHANPCGVAIGETALQAYDRAYTTDPTSAFGGIIALNRPLDAETATAILSRQFVEVIIAPQVEEEALPLMTEKPNIRVLNCGELADSEAEAFDYKRVNGGLLIQNRDLGMVTADDIKVVTKRSPSADELRDLLFAWKVVKYIKSNAIVYCKQEMTVGVGAGQMSRVYSARIAAIKAADANLEVKGSVMASDAFFPFRDGLDQAADVGVTAVIQPGGSVKDEEVIAAADQHDIAMVFTGMRHFRH